MRPSWIEVDLSAVKHNVAQFCELVHPAAVCAVVKADGYGHGDVPVAEAALEAGATWLSVALIEEGVRLREAGIDAPILLLSEPPAGDAAEVIRWKLTPTVYTGAFVSALEAATSKTIAVHLKVDTGMHRVGADPDAAVALASIVAASRTLHLEALWTHLAVAEEDAEFTAVQVDRLAAVSSTLEGIGIRPPLRHAANTAGAMLHPGARFDLVRVGLGLYGLRPAPHAAPGLELKPAMSVVSQVSAVRRLPAGERPSYGRRRSLEADATVATVPIGYADGFLRGLSDHGAVLIHGNRYPLAGTVTMDQIVVDLGDDSVAIGDEVVVLGSQGNAEITADEWADRLGTINYEIVCGFGPRLPRRYRW